ncbi:gamma-glutamylcyclotransferase family protein [Haloarchaeobius sp. TZWSO28]|uniref:gamma-glutamylcyclotransferase family protein n=1 Tax=Haloarchaeobius sp. TZWSO28 TaxID=3446119 RepID=UPI003EBBFE70
MDCFVYGTLTDPARVDELLDDWRFGPDAVLRGAHRVEGEYPTLAPGGETPGRILRTDDIDALDRYEGVDRGLYVRVAVPWAEGSGDQPGGDVQVYVGDPARLAVEDSIEWPGSGSLDARVASTMARECTVVARPE